ncbi:MAG: extracellular solute-binding protein [Anaerolineaceae bacterium]|nr:extracellular solute-binding protein [Anaerolineaceae bacterium]
MKNRHVVLWVVLLAVLVILSLALSGCAPVNQVAAELGLPPIFAEHTAAPSGAAVLTPDGTSVVAAVPEKTPTPVPPQVLTVWVPPEFDPEGDTEAGRLLGERLKSFSAQNPDVEAVEVRVKAAAGASSLLDSLTAASAAAPGALPSLIALRRADLETAALKGLVYPMDGLTMSIDDADWYAYAREMALIQGSVYGLPFAGDALLLAYRPAYISTVPNTWDEIVETGKPLLFPAADPQAAFTLTLYQSVGGSITDTQNRPALDPEVLTEVLRVYQQGSQSGVFPVWLSEYQSDGQAWDGYTERRTDWMITWSNRYLSNPQADTSAVLLPSLGDEAYTIASGWVWALADPDPNRQALSQSLADYLVESDFLTAFAEPSGYLPTRPTALTGWADQRTRSLISQLVVSANLRPANDLVSSLGPVLQESALQVIQYKAMPDSQAQAASERLHIPEVSK